MVNFLDPRPELKVSLKPCGHWARLAGDADEDGVWFANPYRCPTCGECPVSIDRVQDAFMENEELAEVQR